MGRKAGHNYHAFMIRLWRERDDAPWRASLEDPHTGERHHFATAEKLWGFMRAQMVDESLTDLTDNDSQMKTLRDKRNNT